MVALLTIVAIVHFAIVAEASASPREPAAQEKISSPRWNFVDSSWSCTSLGRCAGKPSVAEAKDVKAFMDLKQQANSEKAQIKTLEAKAANTLGQMRLAKEAVRSHKAQGLTRHPDRHSAALGDTFNVAGDREGSSCAFDDLAMPGGASAAGANCTVGSNISHSAACSISRTGYLCSTAQCNDGRWKSPACSAWKLKNEFKCAMRGSNCDSWWGEAERKARGYTHKSRRDDKCGKAAKILFKQSPYDRAESPVYDAEYKGFTMQTSTYTNGTPSTGTIQRFNGKPKKYGPEEDSTQFSDVSWMQDGCAAGAPTCFVGFNYSPSSNLCADSASGWGGSTPASACSYAQHKCATYKVYYYLQQGGASLPRSASNQEFYNSRFAKKGDMYEYEYVFKKWMECTAKNVTANDGGTAAIPNGWDCEVEKRCVCLSCKMGREADSPGKKYYTGEPCSCNQVPASVQGKAGAMCAQT